MTDCVLTEEEMGVIDRWMSGEDFTEETWSYAVYCEAWKYVETLVASHRLLQKRVTELEKTKHWRNTGTLPCQGK